METVLFVELMLIQFQIVHVLITISQTCIKEKKFVKFVMSDVLIVMPFSITVLIVPQDPEDLVLQDVLVQKVS